MSQQFTYRFKPDNWSSHGRILAAIKPSSSVFDVGCAQGYLAEALARKSCCVTGIEIDPAVARQARKYCSAVFVGDIETMPLPRRTFDYIICADVLEHFKRPDIFLRRLKRNLAPSGRLIASIPNVAHFWIRLNLLFGRFEYTERGIMDKTHLRFYTLKTMKRLLAENGYRIKEIIPTPIPLPTISQWFALRRPLGFIHALSYFATRCWKTLFAFQFVIVAQRTR
jgi:2-polyprenyl-3-methyl-5-hydroxy-6-metoxy-1,4-benzoquinol methylase